MSRLSFALTIAVLFVAVVALSVFALQKLFVSGPGNEGSTEATQGRTQATQTTEETTAYGEETTILEETSSYKDETTGLHGEGKLTAAPQEDRCGRTRTIDLPSGHYVTNDVPGCPNGDLLAGTDEPDQLDGGDGEDDVRGLGARDTLLGGAEHDLILGGDGSDVIYGGPGSDDVVGDQIYVEKGQRRLGEDVLYGGDGNDEFYAIDGHRDKLYCGEGRDEYVSDSIDYVASSCEVRQQLPAQM